MPGTLFDGPPPASDDTTHLTPEREPSLERLSVVDLADLLLLALMRRRAASLVVEPAGDVRAAVRFEVQGALTTIASFPVALADAVVARLGILARLPLGLETEQVGRLRLRAEGMPDVEVLVALRSTPRGLIGEIRRIVAPGDAAVEEESGGALLAIGPYRLINELGRGGMGVVYRAEHRVLEKQVALKLLNPGLARVPEFAARFVLEAKAACRARHPGIVDVTDFGWTKSGRAYLVMELVDGQTLQALMRKGPMPLARALKVSIQLAHALAAAAARGVVHRDLKPANVFIAPDGTAKLGDFGVASIHGADGTDGHIVGTARYMAPEQAGGDPADARSDIYALGCVMFEMLTGKTPYDGKNTNELLEKQATAPIPPVVGPDGPLPEAVAAVVRRALAKRPEDRFQSPDALAAELERISKTAGWRRWLAK